MVISFANQKGGVGKSTLCLSLASYWATKGLPVHVVDTDTQQSLVMMRKKELENYPDRTPIFDIESNDIKDFRKEVNNRRGLSTHQLVDLPGRYDAMIIEMVRASDAIIVPFLFEESVLNTTSLFATYLDLLNARYPEHPRTIIFVPNLVNYTIGRKEDREYWDSWKEAIAEVANLSPPIPDRVCMQRMSSFFLSRTELECVTPCFEYITMKLFTNQTTKEDNR